MLAVFAWWFNPPPLRAGLSEFDAAVSADESAGIVVAAKLPDAVTFSGIGSRRFHFGSISGDGTFECIVDATGAVSSGYLAVGSNIASNLRIQQYNATGQVGMTQLGVADYLFAPAVHSPDPAAHLAYVWDGAGTMRMYVNGALAGTATDVTQAFGLPSGAGYLGSSPSGGEGMSGTVYRVVTYDSMLDEGMIMSHAQAFLNGKPVPVIHSFTADPPAVAEGGSVTLHWQLSGADKVTLDGVDVTGRTQKTLTGTASTTTFTLRATNADGTADAELVVPVLSQVGHLVINEFMAANSGTLRDSDGDWSDWLEIWNPTSMEVNLAGYFLTDKATEPQLWPLPAEVLPAGGYRLIFLSDKNKISGTGEWHANFKLSKDGEYLALTGPDGVVQEFSPAFPPQDDDVSYGLNSADPRLQGYMGHPTPGTSNDPALPKPARVEFSQEGGLLRAPVTVALTCATPGAVIHYQLNGGADQIYSLPLVISATTQVTAWARQLSQPGSSTQMGWVRLSPDLANYDSPLPILIIDNFASGPVPQKGWSGTGAGIRQVPRQSAAWLAWERSGSSASTSGNPQFFTGMGLRGRGAFSSSWRQKPYTVEAYDESGAEKEVPVLGMPAHSDWILYFPDPDDNKDPTLLFNTFIYDLSRRLGHDAPRFRWVELFLNEDGGNVSLGDRRGVYAVLEKVSRGKERLDFEKLSADGTEGGWLLNLNRMDAIPEKGWPTVNGADRPQFFRTAGANRIRETQPNNPANGGDDEPKQSNGYLNFDNPGGYTITAVQRASIENWFRGFEDVLYNNEWRDPVKGYRKWLDDRDFAEYFIFNELSKNGDGMLISMFPWKGDDGRLRMGPAWDYNWSSYYVGGAATGNLRWRGDRLWYARLFTDPDFLQLYTDRWFAFRKAAMSNEGMAAIIDAQSAEITSAKAVAQGLSSAGAWQSRLTRMKNWLRDRADWVDSQYLAVPVISVPAGIVTSGQEVLVAASSGVVYHTLEGSDPRVSGGGIAADAGTGNVILLTADTKLTVRARASSTRWSAPGTAVYVTDAVPATAENMVISEIHYHPAQLSVAEMEAGFTDSGDFEFIELLNTGDQKISFGGLRFSAGNDGLGIRYVFDDGRQWSAAPGGRLVIVKNEAAFALRYGPGVPVAGSYAGNLANSGDTLRLENAAGSTILTLTYTDTAPWPVEPDGSGRSLTLLGSAANQVFTAPEAWRASVAIGGSPGTSDTLLLPPGADLIRYVFGDFLTEWSWADGVATVRQPRVPGSDAVTVRLEFSKNLRDWIPGGDTENPGTWQQDGRFMLERVLPVGAQGFVRWRVTRGPP